MANPSTATIATTPSTLSAITPRDIGFELSKTDGKTNEVATFQLQSGALSARGGRTFRMPPLNTNLPILNTYVGEHKNGVPHGNGELTFAPSNEDNYDKYKGAFKEGMFHGEGDLTFSASDPRARYIGAFVEGSAEGDGWLLLRDTSKYDGKWKDGKMHGLGTFTMPNGDTYKGNFVNGSREGNFTVTKNIETQQNLKK